MESGERGGGGGERGGGGGKGGKGGEGGGGGRWGGKGEEGGDAAVFQIGQTSLRAMDAFGLPQSGAVCRSEGRQDANFSWPLEKGTLG